MSSYPETTGLFVSVVLPAYNLAEVLEAAVRDLITVLKAHYSHYEVVIVDDGSTDNTRQTFQKLSSEIDGLRCLRLSRHFGKEIAICAGLETAIGDYIVILSPEIDPPTIIPAMVERSRATGGLIYGRCRERLDEGPIFRRLVAVYYRFGGCLLGLPLHPDTTYLCAFSRQVLNAFLQITDLHQYLRLYSAVIGYPQEPFDYQQTRRHGPVAKRSLLAAVTMLMAMVVANSGRPLRLICWSGLLLSFANLIFAVTVAAKPMHGSIPFVGSNSHLWRHDLLFFILFAVVAAVAEYVASLTVRSHRRPAYFISEELQSSVLMLEPNKRNIVHDVIAEAIR